MKVIFKIAIFVLIILLLGLIFLSFMLYASGHNIPVKTTIALTIAIMSVLFMVMSSKIVGNFFYK